MYYIIIISGGYNGEPADECGVGVLSKGNCIRNSTGKMSAALRTYSAALASRTHIDRVIGAWRWYHRVIGAWC